MHRMAPYNHLKNYPLQRSIELRLRDPDLSIRVPQASPRPTVPSEWARVIELPSPTISASAQGSKFDSITWSSMAELNRSLSHTARVILDKLFNLSEPQFFIEKWA